MTRLKDIKVISFDYGGTLDLPGTHWFKFLWELIQTNFTQDIPVSKEAFWEAYVYGEQQLERTVVPPDTGLLDTLKCKCHYEIDYLAEKELLPDISEEGKRRLVARFASWIARSIQEGNNYKENVGVLSKLSKTYQVNVVSNYYGNLQTILDEAGFSPYITHAIDSTVVGIRKPDSGIWKLAIEASSCRPEEMLVVGDSMKNDILPAQSLGCVTAWLTKETSKEYTGIVIESVFELLSICI
ncbi:Pyrimidine 5'-nucleotidase YjjG [termite gut metagenome]|uniref:Pyrimidine 5'-nucleotidase YjjG n=1 Tax=termite gut metagenome TaxID=433724 RepID=A0A5J4RVV2_9ZZZZ